MPDPDPAERDHTASERTIDAPPGALAPTLVAAAPDALDGATLLAPPSATRSAHESSSLTSEVRTSAPSTRYELGEELGRGGIGRVLLVHDRELGRDVALKELLGAARVEGAASVDAVGRFLREARVTARLEHPGIVPVHELGRRADGSLYYTMKRVRGHSLARALRDARTLEERLATLRAFRDVCDAVAYAHSRGVVHRDLKPDNVMVGEFGETVVLDWGLAKVRDAPDAETSSAATARAADADDDALRTADGAMMGTPSYMSPEQARGAQGDIDERSDVWGLGAILFEILTGEPPFTGHSAMAVLAKVLAGEAPRALDREPRAPPELAAIAERALRRDRDARYRSAEELAGEVGAYLDGRVVRAYDYSSIELLRRFVRRNRAATVAAATVLVAVLGASIFSFERYREERSARAEAETARADAELRRGEAETARGALAEESAATEHAFAQALVERAERALDDREPILAELFAAAALERADPEREDAASIHGVLGRARSAYLAAREMDRWELTNVVDLGAVPPRFTPSLAISRAGSLVAHGEPSRGVFERPDGSTLVVDGDTHVVAFTTDDNGFVDAGAAHAVRALDGSVRVPFPIEPASVRAVAAAGGRVAVAAADGTLVVFDERTGVQRVRLAAGPAWWSVALDPSGQTLAAISRTPPRLVVRDLGASAGPLGAVVFDQALPWPPFHVALGPDGAWVAVGGLPSEVIAYRLSDGAPTSVPGASTTMCMEALDATSLFVLDTGGLRLVDLANPSASLRIGVPIGRTERCRLVRRGDDLWAVLSSPNVGRTWAIARWHRSEGEVVTPHAAGAPILDISAAGTHTIVLTASRVLAWDGPATDATARVLDLSGGDPPLTAVVAASGAIVVGARSGVLSYAPPGASTVRAFTTATPNADGSGALRGMAFLPDGRFVAGGRTGDVEIWDLAAGTRTARLEALHEGDVYGIAVSHDGLRFATAGRDGRVCVLETAAMRLEGCVDGHEVLASHVAFSPDDTLLATADGAGWVRIIDVATRETQLRRRAHGDWINRIAWSPDGELLLAAADDGVSLLDASSLAPLRTFVTDVALNAAFLDDGRRACAPSGSRLVCFDVGRARTAIDAPTARADAARRAGVHLSGFELVPALDAASPVSE